MALLDYEGLTLFKEQYDGQVTEIVADAYSNLATYNVGEYSLYKNDFYRCIVPITVAEEFTEAHWEKVNIGDELNNVTDKAEKLYTAETLTGSIVTIEDGVENMPLKKLTVNIRPVQEGSGDPSPDNIRPITGWTSCNIYHSGEDTSNPTVIPITFPSEAGTVYGGTLEINEDGSGTLTVTYSRLTINSLSLSYINGVFRANNHFTGGNYGYCEVYKTITSGTPSNVPDLSIRFGANYWDSNKRIFIKDQRFTTVEDLKNAVGTSSLVYILITPVTYRLDAAQITTLLGTNNIWADTGDVEVQYGAYLGIVENQLGEKVPKLMIAPVEKTTTASKAYAVNEFLIMGDKLYIVTANIASGGTITIGTNVSETTIGAQITALLNA